MPPAMRGLSAGELLRIRAARNRLLGQHLFLPSAWDILLYLKAEDDARTTTAISAALTMPDTNADRWLSVLRDEGLVESQGQIDGAPGYRLTRHAQDSLASALREGST